MSIRFFDDENISKNLSVGITGLLSNITTREGSHKGGWARLLKCQLENLNYKVKILDNQDDLNQFDVIVFDLGAEFSGALNMFGGLDEKVFKRLTQIKDFKGLLFSWKHELPKLSSLEGRRQNVSTCQSFKDTPSRFLPDVEDVLNKTKIFDHAYVAAHLLIGDSHTPGVWHPDYMICRQDGQTLYGLLKNKTIEKLVEKYTPLDVLVHASSIDIRHHIARQPDPKVAIQDLAHKLVSVLKNVDARAIISESMGIEDESRELPKTGYYKGTPFSGTWKQRNEYREIFNKNISMNDHTEVLKYPAYFFGPTGKLHFEVMERPQSVHISPEHYRWNLDNNSDRWIHEEGR